MYLGKDFGVVSLSLTLPIFHEHFLQTLRCTSVTRDPLPSSELSLIAVPTQVDPGQLNQRRLCYCLHSLKELFAQELNKWLALFVSKIFLLPQLKRFPFGDGSPQCLLCHT